MSDIVFLRAWANVDVPTYCNLVTTALQHREQMCQGMRTTAAQCSYSTQQGLGL
jgi:ribosome biogenesis protein BMS1